MPTGSIMRAGPDGKSHDDRVHDGSSREASIDYPHCSVSCSRADHAEIQDLGCIPGVTQLAYSAGCIYRLHSWCDSVSCAIGGGFRLESGRIHVEPCEMALLGDRHAKCIMYGSNANPTLPASSTDLLYKIPTLTLISTTQATAMASSHPEPNRHHARHCCGQP